MNCKTITNIKPLDNNRRKRFLFITRNIEISIGYELWKGILKKIKEIDGDLICLTGGPTEIDCRSLVYQLGNIDRIDGAIIWTILNSDKYASIYDKFKDVPLVTLSSPIQNYPVVLIDSYKGMRDTVEHLVNVHHYTKIALVRGSKYHGYMIQRYNAYIDVVKENNIYDENLITPPLGIDVTDGVKGIEILLDQRKLKPGKDIEAIVFISDNTALGALNELKSRNIKIPDQIAITGCNAVPEALYASPPITTITMPFAQQSYIAADLLLKLLNNEEIPKETAIPAKILIAQSCGCQSSSIKQAAIDIEPSDNLNNNCVNSAFPRTTTENSTRLSRDIIQEEFKTALHEYVFNNNINEPILDEFYLILLTGLFDEIENDKQGEFLRCFNTFIKKLTNKESNIDFLHDIITIFRLTLNKHIKNNNVMKIADNLWAQARVMIFEALSRTKKFETLAQIKQEETLRDISIKLITTYNIDILMDILVESLPKLNIPSCYISLYEQPNSISSPFEVPEKARLIFACEDGKRNDLKSENIIYPSKDLLPEGFNTQLKRKTIVVQSLHFNDIQMGFIQFELGPENGAVYTILSHLVSSALKGALLVNETIENQKKLLSTEKMASLGRLTAGIAHEMNTPLAAIQNTMKELSNLVEEYSDSINLPEVLPEDHKEIVREMEKCIELSSKSADKSISFIRGIKGQTANMVGKAAEQFVANNVINDTYNLLEFKFNRSKCKLISEIDETIVLLGNPRALSQIITNLINNAIDAADGTEVTITVKFKPLDNNSALLTVEDDGPGIPEENLPRIFDSLFTTKSLDTSSGLGLGIVKDLVDQFKGTIKAKSDNGITQFSIELPYYRNNA